MKTISVHVSEVAYAEFKHLAARTGRPVAELIRDAMGRYLERERQAGPSLLDLPPYPSGAMLEGWSRADLLDEMRDRA